MMAEGMLEKAAGLVCESAVSKTGTPVNVPKNPPTHTQPPNQTKLHSHSTVFLNTFHKKQLRISDKKIRGSYDIQYAHKQK